MFSEPNTYDMKSNAAIRICKYLVEAVPAHVLRLGVVAFCVIAWIAILKLLF